MNEPLARSYLWLFWALAVVGLAADQASKYVVFATLYDSDPDKVRFIQPVVQDHFSLMTNYTRQVESGESVLSQLRTVSAQRLPEVNRGALFGLGANLNGFFTLVSIVACVVLLALSTRRTVRADGILCLALGLILGGTLGNLYDRVVFDGVRDFLYYHGLFEWPVFNVADCCLVCGAALLVLHAFIAESLQVKMPAPQAAASAP